VGQSAEELKRDIERTRDGLGETFDAIGDRVSPGRIVQRRKDAVRSRFQGMKDAVMGTAHDAYGSTTDRVGGVADRAGSMATSAAGTIGDAPEATRRQTRGNPLAAGLIAFGGGLLVAALLPASEQEQHAASALQDHLEPLKERAIEAGAEIKGNLQERAQDAVESVKETATSAADELERQAQSATAAVKDQAQSATQEVKERATS
jgi:uncharacterized protein YjbJ (UPF0337 family)